MPARIFASAARLRLMLLAAQVDRGPTIIRYVEGARMMTVEAPPGLVLPLLTSSTGHVFMAWQPRSIWDCSFARKPTRLLARNGFREIRSK